MRLPAARPAFAFVIAGAVIFVGARIAVDAATTSEAILVGVATIAIAFCAVMLVSPPTE